MNSLLIFASTDELGNITDSSIGEKVVPDRQYDYFIYLNQTDLTAEQIILDYKITEGSLVKNESSI